MDKEARMKKNKKQPKAKLSKGAFFKKKL